MSKNFDTGGRVGAGGIPAEKPEVAPGDSERMLATFYSNLPGMAYRCRNDPSWTIVFVSEGCRVLTGYGQEDLVGNRRISYAEIVHPEDRGRVEAEMQEAIWAGRAFELTYRIITASGGERWVLEHGRAVPAADGEAGFLEGVVIAITARKRAEMALVEREHVLSAMIDNSFEFIGLLDPSGRLLRANRTSLEAVGTRWEEVKGRFFWETPWWTDSAEKQQQCRDAVMRAARGDFVRFETTHPATDDRVLTFDFSLTPVRDGNGRIIALIPEGRDITEQKAAEVALRESEERYAKAFRASPDAISIVEMETGRFLELNEATERVFGFKRSEMLGRTSLELNLWTDSGDRRLMVETVRRDGVVRDLRLHGMAGGKTPFICLFSAEKIELGGRPCLVTVAHDITEQVRAEQALRESEEKFAKAFRASPDAISINDVETGEYIEANFGHERIFGRTREELIGRTTLELGYYRDPAERTRLIAALRANGGSIRDFELACFNGRREPITVSFSGEFIEMNGRKCLVCVIRDVTEWKRSEQALRESEEKFAKAFRASPDAISVSDFATGRIIDVNESFERFSGYARTELIGRTSAELGFWADPNDRRKLVDELSRHGRVREMQVAARSRDGSLLTFMMSAESVEIGGKLCVVILGRDISDGLKAEQALRESEEKFAKAFRSSPYALTITEVDTGCFLDVNWGFERMTGYRRDEVLGKTSLEMNFWRDQSGRDELLRRLRTDGRVRGLEMKFQNRLHEVLVTRCSCDVVELGGKSCLLAVFEDITEQRKAEDTQVAMEQQFRQLQKLEALGQLAGGIAHDFNNILTGILAYAELAVMDAADPLAVGRHLAEVGKAGRRARDLVRQILAFSRQQVKSRTPIRLHLVVQEAIALLRSSLPSSIDIRPNVDPEAPIVLADATQIHQIVMNLCTNSAHAMREGQGVLSIRLGLQQLDKAPSGEERRLQPGRYAVLTISDNGHGMDADTLKRIFEPFFTTKGPGEGTGLGLSVVHGIAEDHDGLVLVESELGKGTAFSIYFPEHIALTESNAAEPAALGPGKGERILLIDDEEMIADSAGKLLGRLGYRVTSKTDPRAALQAFEEGPDNFDLVVTDLTMPRLSGIEVARKVLALRPGLPVLLASGYNATWTLEKVRKLGLTSLINKPLTTGALASAVRAALDEVPPSAKNNS